MLGYARRAGFFDVPNPRSSHSVPTPRGGGVALVASVLGVAAYEMARGSQVPLAVLVGLGVALAALALVGWMDDKGSMPVALRFPVHLGCGFAVALMVNQLAPMPGVLNSAWLAWWLFWTAASINIVNFMDGIDGMVAAQGVVYGVFLFALLPSETAGSRFGLILAAACLGFLLWNWAPAKMFLGDVGSGPLGLFFVVGGALALQGARAALVFLPLFPLFFDALVTLIRRFRHGEKLTVAHRSHLYQRMANGGYGHPFVTSIYALGAAIGAVVAVSVNGAPVTRIALAIGSYVVGIGILWSYMEMKLAHTPGTTA